MKKIKLGIYVVIWRDSCHAFNPDNENMKLAWAAEVGFIMEKHSDRLILARQIFEDGVVRHGMSVASPLIEKVIKVGDVELPKVFLQQPHFQ